MAFDPGAGAAQAALLGIERQYNQARMLKWIIALFLASPKRRPMTAAIDTAIMLSPAPGATWARGEEQEGQLENAQYDQHQRHPLRKSDTKA
jgi:hypothetical protein